jgi:benzylsuccinate CoA-transferase BbsE subunit
MDARRETVRRKGGLMGVPSALRGLKVLDLCQRYGHYCGKLFADMGADVVLVERPGSGCALRTEPPFLDDMQDAEHGIPFFYFNTSKRGITLDLEQAQGRELFEKLARYHDLIIEDGAPGALNAAGLGYDKLAAMRPEIVVVSITPFGQTGPYAQFAADDLTLLAMGGFLHMMGYPDAAPTQAFGNQAYAMGNMFAAVGAMMAVLGSQTSGSGQHVDVSIQECVTMALENAAQFYDLEKRVRTRFAGSQRQAGTGIFECADGSVYIFAGGMAAIRFWGNLVLWMKDERVPSYEILDRPEWSDMSFLNSDRAKDTFAEMFSVVARKRTKEALYREAQSRRVPLCPVSTSADVAASRQLAYRSFFTTTHHAPSQRDVVMPGAPYQLSATPSRVYRPAPTLGQHNLEIYSAIGVSGRELAALQQAGIV